MSIIRILIFSNQWRVVSDKTGMRSTYPPVLIKQPTFDQIRIIFFLHECRSRLN